MGWILAEERAEEKLSVLHGMDQGQSKFIQAIIDGWPLFLSSSRAFWKHR
jgi:hypothetical protein